MWPSSISQSSRTLVNSVKLTFFTKPTCQLCVNAREVLDDVLRESNSSPSLEIVDIMKPENSAAFDKYCYDVPVLHLDRPNQKKPIKFMHFFNKEEITNELHK